MNQDTLNLTHNSNDDINAMSQAVAQSDIIALLEQTFVEHFGYAATQISHAPGRVNLIGDHTDYNGGFVLPAAINFGTWMAGKARNDRTINVVALDCDGERISFSLDDIAFDKVSSWSNYVRGSLIALAKALPDFGGADLVVKGNVPRGAGLSSSASFEVVTLKTMAALYDLPLSGVQAALMGQQAENEFVGCNCGIMDQMISAMGKQHNAMLLDCRSLDIQYARMPEDLAIIIVNSNVKRGLVDSEYNTRRKQCEQAAALLGKTSLRDVTLAELNAAKADLEPILYRRAHHVISESLRTCDMLAALNRHDTAQISTLMAESHDSLKNDFEVTTSQLDILVSLLADKLGEYGGARMTGGGFGGCVVALTERSHVDNVFATLAEDYHAATGLKADVYLCHAVDGAFVAV
ncbi:MULTISPECIES: galactokinase [Shewanella]|uniref:galactokinase n=1 Tax=Shewanella TaxID=22 RepID=UPI000C4A6490|nr:MULTISPECIES: galactokinase [Shewanella]NCQ46641.1 galactokinase [Shewanella frigidimarina]NCO71292.1 galactokinase [Shewanella vesiculosa]NCP37770.1 galactokinase [Shewanella vesiculosa]NCP70081.1 galactokinase [Shewanella vesiculosa]NCP75061.1 galactokinase [Shewanella vesiculosa]